MRKSDMYMGVLPISSVIGSVFFVWLDLMPIAIIAVLLGCTSFIKGFQEYKKEPL